MEEAVQEVACGLGELGYEFIDEVRVSHKSAAYRRVLP
jgi:hypothetical protein